MRTIGGVIVGLGILWIIFALNMDTSVPVDSVVYGGPDSVHNIGLIADRQNHLLLGCLTTIIGILMVLLGGKTRPPVKTVSDEPLCERDLDLAPYKIWLIERYGITRNDVLGHFVFENRTYASVDDALAVAHELELKKEKISEILEKEKAERLERVRKERGDFSREMRIYALGGGAFIIALMASLMFIDRKISSSKNLEDYKNKQSIVQTRLKELKLIGFEFEKEVEYVDVILGHKITDFECLSPSSIEISTQKSDLNVIKQFKVKFHITDSVNESEFYNIVNKMKIFGYREVNDGAWSSQPWDKKMGVGSFSGEKQDGGEVVKLRLIEAINSADVCIFKK